MTDGTPIGSNVVPPAFVGWGGVYGQLALPLWHMGFNPIPIDILPSGTKRPLIKWEVFQAKRMSEATVRTFVVKFGHCPAVAIPTGPGSGITVVDVDGEASDIDWAIETFGEPKAMVETASYGVHLYFRYKGERNATRVAGRRVDIRGDGGLIVGPGSARDGEVYRFILGGWEDLGQLCPMKSGASDLIGRGQYRASAKTALPGAGNGGGVIPQGMRDNELYGYARNLFASYAHQLASCPREGEMEAVFNDFVGELIRYDGECCDPPLGDTYVRTKAAYWWDAGIEGRLFASGHQAIILPVTETMNALAREEPAALGLLFWLKQMFRPLQPFSLPETRAGEFGISPGTLRKRLKILVRYGLVELVHQGGRFGPGKPEPGSTYCTPGDANVYRLPMLA